MRLRHGNGASAGASLGGTGYYCAAGSIKWKKKYQRVGKVNIITNAVLYGICLFLFDVSTVIYSLIYVRRSARLARSITSSLQNINVEVRIITKLDDMGLEQEIPVKMDRGITRLESTGAYTNEKVETCFTFSCPSNEVGPAENIVLKYDPHAFYCYGTRA